MEVLNATAPDFAPAASAEERPLVTNATTLDYQTFLRFQYFHARLVKRFRFSSLIYYIIMVPLDLYLLIASFSMQEDGLSVLGIMLAVILVFSFFSSYIAPRYSFKRVFSENRLDSYTFTRTTVHIVSNGAGQDGEKTLSLGSLRKVYETPYAFYLYINRQQAYIVSKTGFADDAGLPTLREILRNAPKGLIVSH